MSAKSICSVGAYSLAYEPKTSAVPGASSGMIKQEIPALKLKINGSNVIVNNLIINAVGCALFGGVFVAGVASVPATALKTKTSGMVPLRDGDRGMCAGAFTVGSTTVACSCSVKLVSNSKAKGE